MRWKSETLLERISSYQTPSKHDDKAPEFDKLSLENKYESA